MQIIERTIELNKSWERSGIEPKVIRLRRGEHGLTKLRITVTDNGVPYSLAGCTVRFCVQYKGGQFIRENMEVREGAAELVVTSNFTAVAGHAAVSYIEVTSSGNVIDSDTLPVYIMDNVDISSGEAAQFRSEIDEIEQEMNAARDAMLAQKAEFDQQEQARQEAEKKREAAEEGRRDTTEKAEKAAETANAATAAAEQLKSEIEAAEQKRVEAEEKRESQESTRQSNETERQEVDAERLVKWSDILTQWEAIKSQLNTYNTYTCKPGEYDPATGDVQLETGVPGTIYLTPQPPKDAGPSMDVAPTSNVMLEWLWLDDHFELIGSTQVTIEAITSGEIDSVVADENPTSDGKFLSLSGVSNWWTKLKNVFRRKADKIQTADIADGAVTTAQILDGTITIDDLASAVVKRITDLEAKNTEQDASIATLNSAWDSVSPAFSDWYPLRDLSFVFKDEIAQFPSVAAWLLDRAKRGDYHGLCVGDFVTISLTGVGNRNFHIGAFDHYGVMQTRMNHHIVMVGSSSFPNPDQIPWRADGEGYDHDDVSAYLGSDIHNFEITTIYESFPVAWQAVMCDTWAFDERRWNSERKMASQFLEVNLGKIFSLSEFEVIGQFVQSTGPDVRDAGEYVNSASCMHQLPIYKMPTLRNRIGGNRATRSIVRGTNEQSVWISNYGYLPTPVPLNYQCEPQPCFCIGETKPVSDPELNDEGII